MTGAAGRLLAQLPAVFRARNDGTLEAVLGVLGAPLDALDADLAQLYDNWFIETCEDWAVPYLGALLGVAPAFTPASADPARRAALLRALVPRQEVANTIRARRRKGSAALSAHLARDVAGWPAWPVEFRRNVQVTPSPRFPHLSRAPLPTLRAALPLARLDGPFDPSARLPEARSPLAALRPGRYGAGHLGVFVWRRAVFPLDVAPAGNVEEAGPQCFTFSVLGNDAPLFVRPEPHAAFPEGRVPALLTRALLRAQMGALYGPGRSVCVWTSPRVTEGPRPEPRPVPAAQVTVANLRSWAYRPRRGQVALDPQLGRVVFHPAEVPATVWVTYSAAFSDGLGGGPYPRADSVTAPLVLRVGQGAPHPTIEDALDDWQNVRATQPHAVIELTDHGAHTAAIDVTLGQGESLCVRAAPGQRPSIFLLDRQRNAADSFTVRGDPDRAGGCLTLDGLLITGRAVRVQGRLCAVRIWHCTLVPGWGLHGDCRPTRPAAPSLELDGTVGTRVDIRHSILGPLQMNLDEVRSDPVVVTLSDSVLDGTGGDLEAIGAPTWPYAHAQLNLSRCTVIGQVQVERVGLIEDSLLTGALLVARRSTGCVRFSSVPVGSRTPRRAACQPDGVEATVRSAFPPGPARDAALQDVQRRVQPVFMSTRYGHPDYARLSDSAPVEIRQGAQDEGEQGAFHDLHAPQRLAHLRARLDEYTPASIDATVLPGDEEAP